MDQLMTEVVATGLRFPECLRWHGGRLWFSDFFEPAVMTVGNDGDTESVLTIIGEPAGLGWLPNGELIASVRQERSVIRWDGQHVESFADCSRLAPGLLNDLLALPNGNAYVSHFGFDLDRSLNSASFDVIRMDSNLPRANLLLINGDKPPIEVGPPLRFPNGMTLMKNGRSLVVAETFGERLVGLLVSDDGTLDGEHTWAELPGLCPDGICVDAKDAIWVANATASECLRVHEGGKVSAIVQTRNRCFGCCLGGDDGRTLYLATAPDSFASIAATTRWGAIESVRVTVPGLGSRLGGPT